MESKTIATLLLPSGTIHNKPPGAFLYLFALMFYIIQRNATLENNKNLHTSDIVGTCLAYAIDVILMLFTTKNLKKIFKRDRP